MPWLTVIVLLFRLFMRAIVSWWDSSCRRKDNGRLLHGGVHEAHSSIGKGGSAGLRRKQHAPWPDHGCRGGRSGRHEPPHLFLRSGECPADCRGRGEGGVLGPVLPAVFVAGRNSAERPAARHPAGQGFGKAEAGHYRKR